MVPRERSRWIQPENRARARCRGMLSRVHDNRDKERDLRVPGPRQDTNSLFLLRGVWWGWGWGVGCEKVGGGREWEARQKIIPWRQEGSKLRS